MVLQRGQKGLKRLLDGLVLVIGVLEHIGGSNYTLRVTNEEAVPEEMRGQPKRGRPKGVLPFL
jgi:hypothetical protein